MSDTYEVKRLTLNEIHRTGIVELPECDLVLNYGSKGAPGTNPDQGKLEQGKGWPSPSDSEVWKEAQKVPPFGSSSFPKLEGPQCKQLQDALIHAFPNRDRLEMMLWNGLTKRLSTIATDSDLEMTVFKVIKRAESEGWTDQLIAAARKANPGNQELLKFARQFGLAPAAPPRQELKRMTRSANWK